MRFRRVYRSHPDRIDTQAQDRRDGQWHDTDHPLGPTGTTVEAELAMLPVGLDLTDGAPLLPLRPRSFRDFMIHEQHVLDAGRGMMRRHHPRVARVATLVERVTGRDLRAIRPHPLWYRQPIYYLGNALTIVPSGTPIAAPPYTRALDYELELGVVLARPLLDADPHEAQRAIGAYVVLNDVSARDVQLAEMRSGFGPQKSKHFVSSLSAVAVTGDEVPDPGTVTGRVAINGATVATPRADGAHWTVGEMLAHASRGERLFPGELFATGTLPGGSGLETGNWVYPGDLLELTLDGIGTVTHEIR